MTALLTVLNKVVVQRFYRLNTAFFLVTFFLAFGIQQPPSLLVSPAFLSAVVTSPMFVKIILALFAVYYLKCFIFISKTLALPENEYLYVAGLLPPPTIRLAFGLVHLQLFLPALAYTALMGLYGLSLGLARVIVTVVLYNLILVGFTAFIFSNRLRQTLPRPLEVTLFTKTERKLLNHPLWWPLRFLLRQQKVMLLLIKIIGLGALYAFMALYPYAAYGLRPTQIGFLVAVTAHCMLVQQILVFQESGLPFLRQLPNSTLKRFSRQTILFALMLVPELVLVLRFTFFPAVFLSLFYLFGLGVGLLLFFQGVFYAFKFRQTAYVRAVFFIFICLLLGLLVAPPLYLVTGFLLVVAFLLFQRYYYRFELPKD